MSERFPGGKGPEKPKTEKQLRDEFIEQEKEDARAQIIQAIEASKGLKLTKQEEIKRWKNAPDAEMYQRVFNNVHGFLPINENNMTMGMYREAKHGIKREGKIPGETRTYEQLIQDVDEYLAEEGRGEFLKNLIQELRDTPTTDKKNRTRLEKQKLEFMKSFWYYMRVKKGYDGTILST